MARKQSQTSIEKDFKIELTHTNATSGVVTVIGWVNLSDSFAKKVSGISAKDLHYSDLDA